MGRLGLFIPAGVLTLGIALAGWSGSGAAAAGNPAGSGRPGTASKTAATPKASPPGNGGSPSAAAGAGAAVFDIPPAHRKLLESRNFFLPDPSPPPPPAKKPDPPPAKKSDPPPVTPPTPPTPDPADRVVLTGTFEVSGEWAVAVEDVEQRKVQVLGIGERLEISPEWELASVGTGSATFRRGPRTSRVFLGGTVSGQRAGSVDKVLASARIIPAGTTFPSGGAGGPVAMAAGGGAGAPGTVAEGRINPDAKLSEKDRAALGEYLKDFEDRRNKGKFGKGKPGG